MTDHALRALDRLGGSEGLEAHALYLKGEALRAAERHHEALIELHRAADATPDDIHIWISLGWCYKRTNNIELAIHSLKEALAIEPGEALLHYNLACYWCLAGDKDQALDFLSSALEIDPNYRDLVDGEADFDPIREDPDFLALTSVIV
jgi:tetratricopeptide (TPR) repeat protein